MQRALDSGLCIRLAYSLCAPVSFLLVHSVLGVVRFRCIGCRLLSHLVDRLHPFLLSQLKRAADHAPPDSAIASPGATAEALGGQEGKAAVVAATIRAEMHPVLYPILLLLARLRASGAAAETEAEQNEVREERLSDWFCDCFAAETLPGTGKKIGALFSLCAEAAFLVCRGWTFGGSDAVFALRALRIDLESGFIERYPWEPSIFTHKRRSAVLSQSRKSLNNNNNSNPSAIVLRVCRLFPSAPFRTHRSAAATRAKWCGRCCNRHLYSALAPLP